MENFKCLKAICGKSPKRQKKEEIFIFLNINWGVKLSSSWLCILTTCKLTYCMDLFGVSQVALVVKNPPANARDAKDVGLIPGLGGSSGEGNGNPFQYSCVENSMDRGAWWATVHGVTRVRHDWSNLVHRTCPFSFLPCQLIPHQGRRGGWLVPLWGTIITTKNRTFIFVAGALLCIHNCNPHSSPEKSMSLSSL